MIPLDLTQQQAAGMRLGILLTRIERREDIFDYPISSFEKNALPEILKGRVGYIYKIVKASEYWFHFSAKWMCEISYN